MVLDGTKPEFPRSFTISHTYHVLNGTPAASRPDFLLFTRATSGTEMRSASSKLRIMSGIFEESVRAKALVAAGAVRTPVSRQQVNAKVAIEICGEGLVIRPDEKNICARATTVKGTERSVKRIFD